MHFELIVKAQLHLIIDDKDVLVDLARPMSQGICHKS